MEDDYNKADAMAKLRVIADQLAENVNDVDALRMTVKVVDITAKAEAQGLLTHLPTGTRIELCVRCHTIHVRRPDGPQNLWINHDQICTWVQRSFPVREA